MTTVLALIVPACLYAALIFIFSDYLERQSFHSRLADDHRSSLIVLARSYVALTFYFPNYVER